MDQVFRGQEIVEALVRFLFEKMGYKVADAALSSSKGEAGQEIKLALSQADINRFAGPDARLLRATRGLLSAAAAAQDTRVNLEINEA